MTTKNRRLQQIIRAVKWGDDPEYREAKVAEYVVRERLTEAEAVEFARQVEVQVCQDREEKEREERESETAYQDDYDLDAWKDPDDGPTLRQIEYLRRLGYNGPPPDDKHEASEIIDRLRRQAGEYSYSVSPEHLAVVTDRHGEIICEHQCRDDRHAINFCRKFSQSEAYRAEQIKEYKGGN